MISIHTLTTNVEQLVIVEYTVKGGMASIGKTCSARVLQWINNPKE